MQFSLKIFFQKSLENRCVPSYKPKNVETEQKKKTERKGEKTQGKINSEGEKRFTATQT